MGLVVSEIWVVIVAVVFLVTEWKLKNKNWTNKETEASWTKSLNC